MSGANITVRLGALLWDRITHGSESIFLFWAHVLCLPDTGVFLRRAYYRLTLIHCASNFYIGFGALFTHRHSLVEKDAYIGPYALVGMAHLGKGCLIGSRQSTQRHRTAPLDEQGR